MYIFRPRPASVRRKKTVVADKEDTESSINESSTKESDPGIESRESDRRESSSEEDENLKRIEKSDRNDTVVPPLPIISDLNDEDDEKPFETAFGKSTLSTRVCEMAVRSLHVALSSNRMLVG